MGTIAWPEDQGSYGSARQHHVDRIDHDFERPAVDCDDVEDVREAEH